MGIPQFLKKLFKPNPALEQNTKPHVLVVDRRYWGRGASGGYLLDDQTEAEEAGAGQMCILGLYLHKIVGIPRERLLGLGRPSLVAQKDPEATLNQFAARGACWLVDKRSYRKEDGEGSAIHLTDSSIAMELYKLNDTSTSEMTEAVREERIKAKFAKYNVTVEFIN